MERNYWALNEVKGKGKGQRILGLDRSQGGRTANFRVCIGTRVIRRDSEDRVCIGSREVGQRTIGFV